MSAPINTPEDIHHFSAKITVVSNIRHMTPHINGYTASIDSLMENFTLNELRAIQDQLIPYYNAAVNN